MRIVGFYHSLLSDWNHGNAHFLRGLVSALRAGGHEVVIFEPREGWSLSNLLADAGPGALTDFRARYPGLESRFYDLDSIDLDQALEDADLVLVHEWSDPALVRRVGEHRRMRGRYVLLFHDTHHRLVTAPDEMARYDLSHYDGVLAFGDVLRKLYLERGLTHAAWTFHEAADTAIFLPPAEPVEREAELVWVGNWGDDERTHELSEFLLKPVRRLGLRASVYGVRYPDTARAALREAGIAYRGFVPNYRAPEVFARHAVTVHVPRRPYVRALVGVPTIRVFEALACGIPLISAPWFDVENLFTPGRDFLTAEDGAQMQQQLRAVLSEPALARSLAEHGLRTIRARHTCAHRARELLAIAASLGAPADSAEPGVSSGGARCTIA
jgi:spore maturation protein CgeB